jgi:hypothetical protein
VVDREVMRRRKRRKLGRKIKEETRGKEHVVPGSVKIEETLLQLL